MQFEVKRKLQTFEEVVEWTLFKDLAQELASHSQPLSSITFRKNKSNSCIRVKREESKKEHGACWEEITLDQEQ